MVVRGEEGGKPGTWIEQRELPTRCRVRNLDIWIRNVNIWIKRGVLPRLRSNLMPKKGSSSKPTLISYSCQMQA